MTSNAPSIDALTMANRRNDRSRFMTNKNETATTPIDGIVPAHSEWATPSKDDKALRPSNKIPSSFSRLELLLITMVLLMASTVLTTVFVKLLHPLQSNTNANNALDAAPAAPMAAPPAVNDSSGTHAAPSVMSTHEYKEYVQNVLGLQVPTQTAETATSQEKALHWLVYDDMHHVLRPARMRQRYALAVFHMATGRWTGGMGGFTDPSGSRHAECQWPGVYCDVYEMVHAVEIDPAKMGYLSGTLPSEMALLTNLERLVLMDNDLHGTLPSSIFSLTNLYTLQLSSTRLAGTLPAAVSNLTRLALLDLSSTAVHGMLPTELGKVSTLRQLLLSNTGLTGTVPTEFGRLFGLEILQLEHTQLAVGSAVPDAVCGLMMAHRLTNLSADCQAAISCACCTACY